MCGSLYEVAIGTFTLPHVKIETDPFFCFSVKTRGRVFYGGEVCNAPICYLRLLLLYVPKPMHISNPCIPPDPWTPQIHGHIQIHPQP